MIEVSLCGGVYFVRKRDSSFSGGLRGIRRCFTAFVVVIYTCVILQSWNLLCSLIDSSQSIRILEW